MPSEHTAMLIGGELLAGAGAPIAVENPYTTETIVDAEALARTELGREGLEAFQETKHVHMESKIERKEWWYPYREYGSAG
jgi:hypothetical protein